MENELISTQPHSQEEPMHVTQASKEHLKVIGQWTRFFSIMGFIGIGILVLLGFILGALIPRLTGQEQAFPFPGWILGFFYAIFGGIYFPPILFLYRFTMSLRRALAHNQEADLDTAFMNLKSHYRYLGILTVIVLVMYGMGILIFGLVAIFARNLI